MRDCLTMFGDNTVKLKHMNKAGLKSSVIPVSIPVTYHLYAKSCMLLDYPYTAFHLKRKPLMHGKMMMMKIVLVLTFHSSSSL